MFYRDLFQRFKQQSVCRIRQIYFQSAFYIIRLIIFLKHCEGHMMKSETVRITRQIFIDARNGDIQNFYKFIKVIGKGGFATVWLVTSKSNPSSKRAVKIISKSRIEKSPYLQNQFQILSRLDHPTIIRIYETFEDNKNFYFVLDFCEGGDLFEYLSNNPGLSQKDVQTIFSQMITVVKYCHHNHIAHRDLKPQNFLLINKEGLNIKLIDFGMAYQWKYDMKEQLKKVSQKTLGTLFYAAPQILQRGTYNQQCDVWSLGVILYVMVTASFPFGGQNNKQIMAYIKKGKYDSQNKQLKKVSFSLRDLIDKMLKPVNQRIGLSQIFKHAWFKQQKINRNGLKLNFARIRNYKKYSTFKKITISCISSQLSQTQIVKLGQQFKKLDTNFDGYLQLDQFQKCLLTENPHISQKQLKSIIDAIDLDHDGKINYLEFISSCLENFMILKKQNTLNAFRILDKNGDGQVSATQIRNILQKGNENNQQINQEQIEEIIRSCDKNNDGLLDYQEFLKALTQR